MHAVDFLFCRNVTIYFSLDTTQRVMEQLSGCVDRNGFLFIGDAETLWQISDRFAPVEFPRGFVYRLATPDPTARHRHTPVAEPIAAPRVTHPTPPAIAPVALVPSTIPEPAAPIEPLASPTPSTEPLYE